MKTISKVSAFNLHVRRRLLPVSTKNLVRQFKVSHNDEGRHEWV